MNHKTLTQAKKRLKIVGIAVLLALLVLRSYYAWANRVPNIQIPQDTPSGPSAYDLYQAAIQVYVAPPAIKAGEKGIDTHLDNALWHYNPVRPYTDAYNRYYPLAPKEAFLSRNARALRLFREGLKFSCLQPSEQKQDNDFYEKIDRDLLPLMLVEAHVRAQRGDWDRAADSLLDIVKLGYDLARGRTVESMMWGNTIRLVAMRDLTTLLPHLSAIRAQVAARQIEKWQHNKTDTVTILEEEKRSEQRLLLHLIESGDFRPPYIGFRYVDSDPVRYREYQNRVKNFPLLLGLQVAWMEKSHILREYTRCMDWQINEAKKPYRLRSKTWPFPSSNESIEPMELMYPDFRNFLDGQDHKNARSLLVMTQCALQAFRRERGHYPHALRELTPHYLSRAPIDPYSENQPLGYRLRPFKYLAYIWYEKPSADPTPAIPMEPLDNTFQNDEMPPPEPTGHPVYRSMPYTLYSRGFDRHDDGGTSDSLMGGGSSTNQVGIGNRKSDIVAKPNF